MVTFNVYKSTSSGAYVEGVCLATDTKPIAGITNGSILYAVDITDGSVKRYMFNQNAATWVEAEDPCAGGGSGLPDVTYLDEGKTMKVAAGGSWELAYPSYRVSISISGGTATIAKAPLDILNFGGYYELYASFAYDQKIYFASLVSSGGGVDGQGHSVYDFQFAGVIKDAEGAKAVVFDFPNQLQSATSMTGTVTFIPLSGSSGGEVVTATVSGNTFTINEKAGSLLSMCEEGPVVVVVSADGQTAFCALIVYAGSSVGSYTFVLTTPSGSMPVVAASADDYPTATGG